jgi:autotransporter-associated beta strand protein
MPRNTTLVGLTFLPAIMTIAFSCTAIRAADTTANLDDNIVNLAGAPVNLSPDSYWNGEDRSQGFVSNGVTFPNSYNTWSGGYYWSGWSLSNGTNTTVSPLEPNPDPTGWPLFFPERTYASSTGTGHASSNYAVASPDFSGSVKLTLPQATQVKELYLTNTTYTYLSMLNGDLYGGKQFNFSDKDWFKVTITGYDSNGNQVGNPIDTYLADFRTSNSTPIVNFWKQTDLSSLNTSVPIRSLGFSLASSDIGSWGMNTPAYFAMDDFTFAAPVTWSGTASGKWSEAANWGGESLSGSQGIAFSGSNAVTATNDLAPGAALSSLAFSPSAAAFTLSGSSMSLAGNLTNSSTSPQTIDMDVELATGGGAVETIAGDIAIRGNISGSEGLTKSGSAALILSGSNSFTGAVTVVAGTLDLLSPLSLPNGSAVTIGSDAASNFAPVVMESNMSATNPAAVPEPGTLALLASLGALLAVYLRMNSLRETR